MEPVSPVLPGHPEITYAKDQPQYFDLPAVRDGTGRVVTRWRLSWYERLRVLWVGDIYLSLLTFNLPLQPVKLQVAPPILADQAAYLHGRVAPPDLEHVMTDKDTAAADDALKAAQEV